MNTASISICTQLTADDRGVAYGDGLFETMRVHEGQLPLWHRHRARLAEGLERLQFPHGVLAPIEQAVMQAAQSHQHSICKLIVTRGSGKRGYAPHDANQPHVLIQTRPAPSLPAHDYAEGIAVRFCDLRLAEQPVLAGLKHLNRLENVMARTEWQDAHIREGLLRNAQDEVICATSSNVCLKREGVWFTPKVDRCGVAGTLRAELLARFALQETRIPAAWLHDCDGLFLCNAVRGIMPVSQLDGRAVPMPADLAEMMQQLWHAFPMYVPDNG